MTVVDAQYPRRSGMPQSVPEPQRNSSKQQRHLLPNDSVSLVQNRPQKHVAGIALSAQAGLHRKPHDGLEGLHVTKDPESVQMTHSATFNNYKRHV